MLTGASSACRTLESSTSQPPAANEDALYSAGELTSSNSSQKSSWRRQLWFPSVSPPLGRSFCSIFFGVTALVPRGDPRSDRDVTAARSASPRAVRSPRLAPTQTPSRPCQDLRDVAARLRPRDTTIKRRRARRASPAGRADPFGLRVVSEETGGVLLCFYPGWQPAMAALQLRRSWRTMATPPPKRHL